MTQQNKSILGRVHSYTLKDLRTKVGADESRRISGYANAATIDRGDEFVEPSAFKSSLKKFMENPIVFYNHDWDMAIGKVINAEVTNKGLYVDIEIGKGFETADMVWAQIEQGILKAFSIGFRPLTVEWDEKSEILTIKDMELYEVSVVTIPMNRESLFEIDMHEDRLTGVKFMDKGNYVSYKSLVASMDKDKTKKETIMDSVNVKVELDTEEAESKIEALTAKAAELQESLKVTEEKNTELVEEQSLKIAELEAKLAEAEAALATSANTAELTQKQLTAKDRELAVVKVKHLFEKANIPDLIKSVIQ